MKETHTKILDYVTSHILEHGYSPTTREIADGVGYTSTATVFHHLRDMREIGLLNYVDECPRTITLPGYQYINTEGREAHGRTGKSCHANRKSFDSRVV